MSLPRWHSHRTVDWVGVGGRDVIDGVVVQQILRNYVTIICVAGGEKHCAAVGGASHQRGLHRHRADHGLGQQGDRDPQRGDRPPRRGLHAQEGTETQVLV